MPRAVRFHETGGPDVLRVEDVDVPDPGPGEVRIRAHALGVNRAEAMLAAGTLHPVVDRTFALADVVAVHEYLESNARFGKVVLTVD